jgi:hypothetical protein
MFFLDSTDLELPDKYKDGVDLTTTQHLTNFL